MQKDDSKLMKMCAWCCKREPGPNVRPQFTATVPLMRCSKCKSASYCSKECQEKAWGNHKKPCAKLAKKGLIACVMLHSGDGIFKQVYLSADDPRFDAASASPVMHVSCLDIMQKYRYQLFHTSFSPYLFFAFSPLENRHPRLHLPDGERKQ
jgi:hypothetical protein